ncbi:unnamed protein product, partial [Laminaria digitata]
MCDEDEVWQVAGNRRRRHRLGSESSKPKIRRRAAAHQISHATSSTTTTTTTTTTMNKNTDTTTTNTATRDARRGKKSPASTGYSYSTRGGKEPSRNHQQQQQQADREELVRIELQKLEQLKALLMQTALWQRLVEGLESILPQLGLAFPPPELKASLLEPVSVELPLQGGQIQANAAAPTGEALLEGRCGDAAEAGCSSCSSRIVAAVRSGASCEEVGAWCLGAGLEDA